MTTRKVIRGDSDSFSVIFSAKSTNCKNGRTVTRPIDICDWDIKFTVRKAVPSTSTASDKDAVIHKQADIIDGKNGVAYFTITSADTNIEPGEYWYDIQYIRPIGCTGEVKVRSLPRGKYIILGDITRNQRY